MRDHGSEGDGAQVLPDPDLGLEKVTCSHTPDPLYTPQAPFTHPTPPLRTPYPGWGYWKPPKNLPPSSTTTVPNLIVICPAIWISIENKHTHIAFYVLEDVKTFHLPFSHTFSWVFMPNISMNTRFSWILFYIDPKTCFVQQNA